MGPKQKTKTPTKQTTDSFYDESFSPIKFKESPIQNRQGNLTGSARKLKDGAADLHNLTQKWQVLNVDGANVVSEIANIKLEKILGQDEEGEKARVMLPESLLHLCEKLENLLKRMEKICDRLCGLSEMSKGVSQLEHHSNHDDDEIILFQTWNVDRFATVFTEISEMYSKELKLKQCISENICHGNDRQTIMFYNAAWVHEPYIESNMKLLLESMLVETKHKT
ncbi:cyclin-dependent kinase 2-interacting protein-like [Ruditapes philippinarum]|uniref:cyclin-dependent kinase 2-interacting protein-like n=1 Tax=Ruditapes philippinarum TaxID=129788 RepID=UPI00295A8A2F|nr:cyclin-dependent kinase 2-interacting protein-like [Ruditapes philippinarum]